MCSSDLATIEAAGRLAIPFTTGILIGIGETRRERIESLLALRDPVLLASFPRQRFVSAANADYKPILEIGKSIGLID